jgi:hypothetical protein
VNAAIWNLVAGTLAAVGGAIFVYLAYLDGHAIVIVGALIGFLSGVAWIISAIIGIRQQ